jgi:hypothetical protein
MWFARVNSRAWKHAMPSFNTSSSSASAPGAQSAGESIEGAGPGRAGVEGFRGAGRVSRRLEAGMAARSSAALGGAGALGR